MKNKKEAIVKEEVKEEKKVIKAETGKSDTGFFRLTYRDGMKKDSKEQSLKAFIKDGIAVFSNGNFSQFGNGHQFTVQEQIKPFGLRVKKVNVLRHVSIHGENSPVLKKVIELGVELY